MNLPLFTTAGLSTFKTTHHCGSIFYVRTQDQLIFALSQAKQPLVLGGGSNVLFWRDIDRDIIVMDTRGILMLKENNDHVFLKVAAGESWHRTVCWAVDQGYGGIENLSLIPGKCGAAPMQNIGAYGVEIGEVIDTVEALHHKTLKPRIFKNDECLFGYRDSIFKQALKDQYIITAIVLKLNKAHIHRINDSYGAIREELAKREVDKPSIRDISEVVISIRSSKLPDPGKLPNAGSFFKNPIVDESIARRLIANYPDMPIYPAADGLVKLAAGWLIDRAGWRGRRIGHVGSHIDQALVLVNYDGTNGNDIVDLARLIKEDVLKQFGVTLEEEVNLV